MTYQNESDGLIYKEVQTPYGQSLVVTNAQGTELERALNGITNSLSSWYQPFSLEYYDGVTVNHHGDIFYIKNMSFDENLNQFIIDVFDSNQKFYAPCEEPKIDFPDPLVGLSYPEVGGTSFFSEAAIPIGNSHAIVLKTEDEIPTVSIEDKTFKGTLYTYNDTAVEICGHLTEKHMVYIPGNDELSACLKSFGEYGDLRLAGEKIYFVQAGISYNANIVENRICLSTLANPNIYFDLEELL